MQCYELLVISMALRIGPEEKRDTVMIATAAA
jgi:hypothetical protein